MNKLKVTILSLSLITVMAGAATAPALGAIGSNFNNSHSLLIKMIVTLPPLFIIITVLFFSKISNLLSSKPITIIGLILYIIGGCGAGLVNNIYFLLFFRAILGVGVGLIMPLSTGLISYYFDKSEQSKLMGYSSAMNNLGGIIAMSLSGYLVTFNWRYSFAVYLLGLLVLILISIFLPDTKLKSSKNKINMEMIKKIYPYLLAIFVTMLIFYILPSNFSMIVIKQETFTPSLIGTVMSAQTLGAFIMGMKFSYIKKIFKQYSKYISVIMILLGYLLLASSQHIILIAVGLFSIGLGLGLIVPLLNSQVAIKTHKEEVTSAMAIMSSMLYLGQFTSPLIVQLFQNILNINYIRFPYYFAIVISFLLLVGMKKIKIDN